MVVNERCCVFVAERRDDVFVAVLAVVVVARGDDDGGRAGDGEERGEVVGFLTALQIDEPVRHGELGTCAGLGPAFIRVFPRLDEDALDRSRVTRRAVEVVQKDAAREPPRSVAFPGDTRDGSGSKRGLSQPAAPGHHRDAVARDERGNLDNSVVAPKELVRPGGDVPREGRSGSTVDDGDVLAVLDDLNVVRVDVCWRTHAAAGMYRGRRGDGQAK